MITRPAFWLGRQPILDAMAATVGYELLFRSDPVNAAQVDDHRAATAIVINHAYSELGIAAVLGECRGFINFDGELLMSDVVELLPPERTVIELLEGLDVTQPVIERCRDLRSRGFSFALDDVVQLDEVHARAAIDHRRGEDRRARDAARKARGSRAQSSGRGAREAASRKGRHARASGSLPRSRLRSVPRLLLRATRRDAGAAHGSIEARADAASRADARRRDRDGRHRGHFQAGAGPELQAHAARELGRDGPALADRVAIARRQDPRPAAAPALAPSASVREPDRERLSEPAAADGRGTRQAPGAARRQEHTRQASARPRFHDRHLVAARHACSRCR